MTSKPQESKQRETRQAHPSLTNLPFFSYVSCSYVHTEHVMASGKRSTWYESDYKRGRFYMDTFRLISADSNHHLADKAAFPDHCCKAPCIIYLFLVHFYCNLLGLLNNCIHFVIIKIYIALHVQFFTLFTRISELLSSSVSPEC